MSPTHGATMFCKHLGVIFFTIFIILGGGITPSALAAPLSCHKDCSKLGNCNQETGECECPFGRSGKACEHDHLSACRLTPDGAGYCDGFYLQSCECLSQCQAFICDSSGTNCDYPTDLGPHRVCYSREKENQNSKKEKKKGRSWFSGGSTDSQIINLGVPYESDTDARYYRGYDPATRSNITYSEATIRDNHQFLPLDECPDRCNHRGFCRKWADNLDSTPECACYHGFGGGSCQDQRNVCTNECSGRGACKDFFCHCEPPYWGVGCGRSQAFPAENVSMSNPANFKIYMYDLPAYIAYQPAPTAGWQGHDPIYIAYQFFLKSLLKSNVRTEDPSEAHLFFLPAHTYAYTSNLGNPNLHVTSVIEYVREKYPYWNRSDGRDHIVWAPGDRSSCYLESPEAKSLIKLTHFGYFDHTAAAAKQATSMILNVPNQDWGCYHPLRDVVMPPYLPSGGRAAKETFIERINSAENPLPDRKELLFFAGGFRPNDLEYSGRTRHIIAEYIDKWNDSEIQIVHGSVENYEEVLRTNKFCLAPYGHGWGLRIVSIMATGCIPVIIQDHVYQAYEEILPYEEFSIRLNNDDIPQLPSILRSISPEQLAALQAGVAKYWPAFIWEEEFGGRAFEYGLLALRRRHMHLKGRYYGRHSADLFRKMT